MFSKKNRFSDRLKYDEKSFRQINNSLKEAGFLNIKVKIPDTGYENFPSKELELEEFMSKKYNFVSIILVAQSDTKETIKILFINNSSAKTSFNDTVFPSSHSNSPKYYVETKDPARLHGLMVFLKDLLIENSIRTSGVARMQDLIFGFSSLYLMFPLLILSSPDRFQFISGHMFSTVVLPIIMITAVFFLITHPGGVYLGPFEHPITSFIRRAFVGDMKNNLMVSFFVWILKVVGGGVLIFIIGNVVWTIFGDNINSFFLDKIY